MRKLITLAGLFICCLSPLAEAQLKYTLPGIGVLRTGKDTVKICFAGDMMMHTRQLQYDYHTFLEGISPELKKADIAVANMEFALGGEPYSGYPCFSAPDGYATYMASDCGIDVMLLANNHIFDKGSAGLERTLQQYREIRRLHGSRYTGAYSCAEEKEELYPLMVSRKGIRFAFINFTYGTNMGYPGGWPDASRMQKEDVAMAIQRAREQKADFIIALPHWGEEYVLKHGAKQEEWAEWLADQGVDAIIGAHPHVVQDSTKIKGVPVFYSLGNSCSNMSAINTRVGLIVTLTFTVDFSGTVKEMLEPETAYTWCTLPGMLTSGYKTIFIKEWATRNSEWLIQNDYFNMMSSYARVKSETGVED